MGRRIGERIFVTLHKKHRFKVNRARLAEGAELLLARETLTEPDLVGLFERVTTP